MDYFTKNKVLVWCVVVLMIMNCVTLGSFWIRRAGGWPHRPLPEARDGGRIMQERLGLTAEQEQRLEDIRREHFRRTRPLQDDMHRIRLDLVNELFAAEPNAAAVGKMLDELQKKSGQFERDLYDHFQQLKQLCSKEQLPELHRMLLDLVESTRPRDPGKQGRGAPSGPGPHRMPPPRR